MPGCPVVGRGKLHQKPIGVKNGKDVLLSHEQGHAKTAD